mgnify:CR=1 FL=1
MLGFETAGGTAVALQGPGRQAHGLAQGGQGVGRQGTAAVPQQFERGRQCGLALQQGQQALLVFRRLVETTNQAIRVADAAGRIWLAGWDCRDVLGYNPATNQWTRVDLPGIIGGTAGRGITVDAEGRVWLAYATTSDGPSGGLLSWDSNRFAANANIPSTAVTRPASGSAPGVPEVANAVVTAWRREGSQIPARAESVTPWA